MGAGRGGRAGAGAALRPRSGRGPASDYDGGSRAFRIRGPRMPRRFCHATPMSSVANISAYKFVSLDGLPELRERCWPARATDSKARSCWPRKASTCSWRRVRRHRVFPGRAARGCALRRPGTEVQLQRRGAVPQAAGEDQARDHPHEPSGHPPRGRSRAAVDARTVARWLAQGADDAGRPVVMLDTRNAFEVDEGTFRNAIDWRIERFTQFPDAVQAPRRAARQDRGQLLHRRHPLREGRHLHERGGIDHVYQLEGGISSISRKPAGRATRASASCSTSACRWIRRWRPAGPEPRAPGAIMKNPP